MNAEGAPAGADLAGQAAGRLDTSMTAGYSSAKRLLATEWRLVMMHAGEALPVGTRVEQFVVERFLGVGGFGVTYLARDESLGVWRALKEYLPEVWGARLGDGTVGPRTEAYSEDYWWGLEQFLKEARILAQFEARHIRHIVRVYQVFEARGTAYMAMEYVEGRTLEAEVEAEGPLSEDRMRGLLLGLTEGLSEVHAAGVLHRDITPRNVMIREDGTPVVIDFGAARQATGDRSGDVRQFLTPGCAPLEQYVTRSRRGSSAALKLRQGPWTDIYALGAVAYWALSRPEYREKLDEAPARQVVDELPPLLEAAGHAVSESLSLAVSSALSVNAEDRPQSVEQWRQQLEGSVVPVRVPVPAGGADVQRETERPPPPWRRWWLGAASAGVAVAVVVLLVALFAFRNGGVPGPESPIVEVTPGVGAPFAGGPGSPDSASDRPPVSRPEPPATDEPDPPSPEEIEAGLGLDIVSWRLIQLGLASLGFDPGLADGVLSPDFRLALRAWQGSRGESATGYLDSASASALRAAGSDPRAGTVFRECSDCPEMVVLPGGDLAMGRYEVTVGEYRAFASATGGTGDDRWWDHDLFPQTDRHPVTRVNWDDAQAYVSWLSRRTGATYRLPTEAEWERAAAGSQPGCDRLGRGTRPDGTCPVGQYGTNAAGLSDMVGNLWEWTSDCWDANCGRRVLRGGSWLNVAELLRPGARSGLTAGYRNAYQGFRVSRTLEPLAKLLGLAAWRSPQFS